MKTPPLSMESVVAELEGTLVKNPDPFSYFMLVAFEASGFIRFALLLLFWPVIRVLHLLGMEDAGLRLTVFIAVAGLRMSQIESVARAVLPKFYMDDLNMDGWSVFSQYDKKIVVTKTPGVMVERFVKEHLRADEVIGSELVVNQFGFATGLVRDVGLVSSRVAKLFGDEELSLGMGKSNNSNSFMSICKVSIILLIQLTCVNSYQLQCERQILHDKIVILLVMKTTFYFPV